MIKGLEVTNLSVAVNGVNVVSDVSFVVAPGETHVLMGPNGSGKSSLLYALMGHPRYVITAGRIMLDGMEITHESPENRATSGLFLSFQHPVEVPGVTMPSMVRAAANAIAKKQGGAELAPAPFVTALKEYASRVDLLYAHLNRGVNEGFSGGEKKKSEIIQLLTLKPKTALLDEIDSGLDIDAVKTVLDALCEYKKETSAGLLLVTHNPRILDLIAADTVTVLMRGSIVASGGREVVERIEKEGFAAYE